MGNFDVMCAESRIPLTGEVRLLLIAESAAGATEPPADLAPSAPGVRGWRAPGEFFPIAVPLTGRYDREGGIVLPDPLPSHGLLIQSLFRTIKFDQKPKSRKLGDVIPALRQGMSEDNWARSNGRRISYVLFDAKVYDAMARTVEKGGRADWDATKKWYGRSTTTLLSQAFPIPDLRTTLFGKLEAEQLEKLRFDIVSVLKLKSFGFRPTPIDIEGAQTFTGVSGPTGVESHIAAARERYAAQPLLLAAVEAAEARWKAVESASQG
jgi:hypothetical protein